MKKITFLLALLFTFVGVMPSMAFNDLNIDVSKTYTIKTSNSYYLYLTTSGKYTFVTYDTGKNEDLNNEIYHFVFEETGESSPNGNKLYYIRPVTSQNYAYDMQANTRGVYFEDGQKTKWCVVDDGEGNHLITLSDCSMWWRPASADSPVFVSNFSGVSRNLKIEATDGSELGGGESGGGESGGGSEEETPIDYTPNHTGAKTRTNRLVTSFTVNSDTYSLSSSEQLQTYVDKSSSKTYTVEAGQTVSLGMSHTGSQAGWMNAFVYIDADKNGFTASIKSGSNYEPAGDLVSYSFYNNGSLSDASGWNSAGTSISGNNRSTLELPSFTAPTTPGTYRMRAKYDWCNIDPNGATGTYFGGTFTSHGGAIIDFTLVVTPKKEPIVLTLAQITDDDNLLYGLEGYITTFSAPYATTIPGDVTAYYAQEVGNSEVISLTELSGGVVPANFGVVLVGNAATATMEPTDVSTVTPNNAFSHSASGSVELGENCYVLANGQDGKGLYLAKTGLVLPANKAYLQLLASSQTSAFRFVVGETTAIQGVATEIANTSIYDLSGRRVFSTTKGGVYIQNGKKFIVK